MELNMSQEEITIKIADRDVLKMIRNTIYCELREKINVDSQKMMESVLREAYKNKLGEVERMISRYIGSGISEKDFNNLVKSKMISLIDVAIKEHKERVKEYLWPEFLKTQGK